MDYMSRNIAVNLKRIRAAKNMTLDEVSEQTGVSKSMLGAIERGDSSPTINILSKIVSGLRVTLDDLVKVPRKDVYIVDRESLVPTKEARGKYKVNTYFAYEDDNDFEIYGMEIQPNSAYISESHGENTGEYVTVSSGTLTLYINDTEYKVEEGGAIYFASDRYHEYRNKGNTLLKLVSCFRYHA